MQLGAKRKIKTKLQRGVEETHPEPMSKSLSEEPTSVSSHLKGRRRKHEESHNVELLVEVAGSVPTHPRREEGNKALLSHCRHACRRRRVCVESTERGNKRGEKPRQNGSLSSSLPRCATSVPKAWNEEKKALSATCCRGECRPGRELPN